jgi:hypothetical protein
MRIYHISIQPGSLPTNLIIDILIALLKTVPKQILMKNSL